MEFVLFLLWVLYYLPFGVAASKEHESPHAILLLNVFTGWTGVGWVLALVWALHPNPAVRDLRQPARVIQLRPS